MADGFLWPGATPLMRAVSDVGAGRPALPVEALGSLWNPATCPPDALPHLAAAVGVAVWKTEWDESLKRRVIARTIALKRRRGTTPTFREFLSFVEAELVEVRAGPSIAAPRPARTQAERDAWAAQFPELRVYAYRTRHERRRLVAPGRPLGGSRRILRPSVAAEFASHRATVVEGGVEREIRVTVVDGVRRAAIPANLKRLTPGRPLSRAFARPSTAADRVFTYRSGSIRLDAIPASLTPLDVQPKRVAQSAQRRRLATPGLPLGGSRRILRPSSAAERVFDSLRILDREKVKSGRVRRRGGVIMGRTRLGHPPYVVELAVDLTRKGKRRRPLPKLPGFARPHDGSRTAEAIEAVRAAKLGRDKVLIRTGLSRPIAVGGGATVGSGARVGQVIRSL